jgi:hypothetical protein
MESWEEQADESKQAGAGQKSKMSATAKPFSFNPGGVFGGSSASFTEVSGFCVT